jgi:putative transposase
MRHRAYKYRFYPTQEQEVILRKSLGCARFVYNYFLDYKSKKWKEEQQNVSMYETSRILTQLKKEPEYEWLKEPVAAVLQCSLINLNDAYQRFFKGKANYPKFKKKSGRNSIYFSPNAFSYKNGNINLYKCGVIDIRWSRTLPDGVYPKSCVVSLEPSGRWCISILVEDPTIEELDPVEKSIGLDMGINHFVVSSDGEKIKSPELKKEYKKLKKLQRRLSKKQKGSNNRNKARIKVAKQYKRITDIRTDFQHKLSTKLVRENQTICLETLNIVGMVKNRKLSRVISEASWGTFINMLEYKCDWYGRNLVKIDRWYPSSKTCSACGSIQPKMPLSVREWTCPDCGAQHDRDVNAAKNILAVGNTVNACGGNIRPKEASSRGNSVEAGNSNRKVE